MSDFADDAQRPMAITKEEFDRNYERTFGKKQRGVEANGEQPASKSGKGRKARVGPNPTDSVKHS